MRAVPTSASQTHGGWHAIVEIKIYAGYGHDQVGRYLRSLRPGEHGVVVAVTRDVPRSGESVIDTRWAGSVQWSTLLPGLRRLRPIDRDLAGQWPLFLDVLEAEGDMGFTKANPELFQAWANYPAARQHLVEFLDTMRRALLDRLRTALAEDGIPREAAAGFFTRGKVKRTVVPKLGSVLVGFRVPAARRERLWAGLWGWGDPRFVVMIPYPAYMDTDRERAAAAVASLLAADFTNSKDRWLRRYLPLTPERLATADLQEQVLDFARESFASIARSGVLQLASSAAAPADEDETGV